MNCEVCNTGPLTQDESLTISSATKRHTLCGRGGCLRSFFNANKPDDRSVFPPTKDNCVAGHQADVVATVIEGTRRPLSLCGDCFTSMFFDRSGGR